MYTNPFDLSNQVALVTGSSRGIGLAIAKALLHAGAKVIISSRKEEACLRAAQALNAALGEERAFPFACHVGDEEALKNLLAKSEAKLGMPRIVVANAASNPYYGPLVGISNEAWDKTFNTNVRSVLRLAGLCFPKMAAQGGGSFLAISSVSSLHGSVGLGAYGASKAALNAMVRSLAVQWGAKNIRVNAILPGLVRTDFARALWDDPAKKKQEIARHPLGRIGEPDDIGPGAVFLCSPASSWLTGQTLVIDGGSTTAR